MSLIGVTSSSYEHLRQCGELIDKVLFSIHTGQSSVQDIERQRLAKLLQDAGSVIPGDLESLRFARILKMIAELEQGHWERQWNRLGKALLSEEPSSFDIDLLETLAVKVDAYRTDLFARLRGRPR